VSALTRVCLLTLLAGSGNALAAGPYPAPDAFGPAINDSLWAVEFGDPQMSTAGPSTFTVHQNAQTTSPMVTTSFDRTNKYWCDPGNNAGARPCVAYIKIFAVSEQSKAQVATEMATKFETTTFSADADALFRWTLKAQYTTNPQGHTGDIYCALKTPQYTQYFPDASVINTDYFSKISGDISWVNDLQNKTYQAPVVRLLFNVNYVPPNDPGVIHSTTAATAYMVDENNIEGIFVTSKGHIGAFSMKRLGKPTIAANPQCP
jgi:hypothetical protein